MQFLATVAGVSPYIGLLGTVWGIINAFHSLTQTSQATIALVAPGIAEALVATAMGLLAAIPALIAYNYFAQRLEQMEARFENFSNQYLNILQRTL
jgi:biopolymer transport protein TolQ